MQKDLLKLLDLSKEDIIKILNTADQLKYSQKHGLVHDYLRGKTLAMIFEKNSTRTRVSFETGMYQLGGHALFLSGKESQIGRGEPIEDTARVLARYCDGIMIRTFHQEEVESLASHSHIPVINGLTDFCHPCQVLADLMTVREHKATLEGLKLCYIGDGNNMANSLIVGGLKCGMEVSVACPAGYDPDPQVLAFAASQPDFKFSLVRTPQEAAAGADVVKQWSAVLDGKTRDTHRELDHQIREMDKPFETHGKKAMYPHDFGDPAEDCNCRCTLLTRARAALDKDELAVMQKRAEFFGLDKTDSFAEFREKYLKAAEQQVSTKFIKDAKDFDSLEKYLKKAYNINVDTSVKQLDFATVKTTLEGVESMLNEFPGLANELEIIETGKSGVMACFGQSITFNPAFFQTQGKLQDECKKAVNSKWWVDNASPASIGVHESAHAVEWMLLQKTAHIIMIGNELRHGMTAPRRNVLFRKLAKTLKKPHLERENEMQSLFHQFPSMHRAILRKRWQKHSLMFMQTATTPSRCPRRLSA